MKSISNDLVTLYDKLQKHTIEDCKAHCNLNTCCRSEYCDRAALVAARYGVTIAPTGHKTLPFMGESGCVVPPHYRPECTEYACCIRDHGGRQGNQRWTDEYYRLRKAIFMVELREKK